jgi:hypothetical protein
VNHKTALFKTEQVPDRTSDADQAPRANQFFFVVDTTPPDREQRPSNKTKFLYDDDLAYLIE